MELLIVTGMSGAGKSLAANALEDMGYYCVDNIPPAIIPVLVVKRALIPLRLMISLITAIPKLEILKPHLII